MKYINRFKCKLLFLMALTIGFASCEEDMDQWTYKGPALASFPHETSGNFFIEDTPDASFTIDLALNTMSSSERSISLSVNQNLSTAIENTHYTLPKTVTIPANSVIGTLEITGIYDNLPDYPLQIVLEITGDNVAEYDNTYTLNIYKFVPFAIENFTGTFVCTESSYFGDFTYEVELTPSENNQAVEISGFGGGMEAAYGLAKGSMNALTVNFITTDPSAYSTFTEETVAFTIEGVDSYFGPTTGILNTLSNSFTLGEFAIYDSEGAWDMISGVSFSKKQPE